LLGAEKCRARNDAEEQPYKNASEEVENLSWGETPPRGHVATRNSVSVSLDRRKTVSAPVCFQISFPFLLIFVSFEFRSNIRKTLSSSAFSHSRSAEKQRNIG
jgi:hypothetical protein